MKLTPENIMAIEVFLTRWEGGEHHEPLASLLFPTQQLGSARIQLYAFLSAMRALGVLVGRGRGFRIREDELTEFRAWKASRNGAAAQDHA